MEPSCRQWSAKRDCPRPVCFFIVVGFPHHDAVPVKRAKLFSKFLGERHDTTAFPTTADSMQLTLLKKYLAALLLRTAQSIEAAPPAIQPSGDQIPIDPAERARFYERIAFTAIARMGHVPDPKQRAAASILKRTYPGIVNWSSWQAAVFAVSMSPRHSLASSRSGLRQKPVRRQRQ